MAICIYIYMSNPPVTMAWARRRRWCQEKHNYQRLGSPTLWRDSAALVPAALPAQRSALQGRSLYLPMCERHSFVLQIVQCSKLEITNLPQEPKPTTSLSCITVNRMHSFCLNHRRKMKKCQILAWFCTRAFPTILAFVPAVRPASDSFALSV